MMVMMVMMKMKFKEIGKCKWLPSCFTVFSLLLLLLFWFHTKWNFILKILTKNEEKKKFWNKETKIEKLNWIISSHRFFISLFFAWIYSFVLFNNNNNNRKKFYAQRQYRIKFCNKKFETKKIFKLSSPSLCSCL